MPIEDALDYHPPLVFKSGHLNTIYPYFFRNGLFKRKRNKSYKRQRFTTSDNDFVDLDCIFNDSNKLAILCHGLEGCSQSQYINHLASLLVANGWDIIAINQRSCSGELNRKLHMYHSGFTRDLHEVVSSFERKYDAISLIGFSLGGNQVLKYATDGIYEKSKSIVNAVGVSVPIDLISSEKKLTTRQNYLYEQNFLRSLSKKVALKSKDFSEEISMETLKQIKSLREFDNHFTGPLHGFKDADDYYRKSSSLPFLKNADIPILLINALDDPFLDTPSFPYDIAKENSNFHLLAPKYGGHIGFANFKNRFYWHEYKILEFLNAQSKSVNHNLKNSDSSDSTNHETDLIDEIDELNDNFKHINKSQSS